MRHAKSIWGSTELADISRPLNKRGEHDAPLMGKILKKEYQVKPDLILSSPAKRAQQTARLIAKATDYPKEKIEINDSLYASGASAIFNAIQSLDKLLDEVIIISHNPDLTTLANQLSDQQIEDIPTCGVVRLDFKTDSWRSIRQGSGIFKFFAYPRKHS